MLYIRNMGLCVCFFLIPCVLVCMRKKVSIVTKDNKKNNIACMMSKEHTDKELVYACWQGKEKSACKCMVGSLAKNNIQHCFINNKKIGTFNGYEKVATTYCNDSSITLSYDDFMNSILPSKVQDVLFIIDEQLYDIQGTKMMAGYEKMFDKKPERALVKNKFTFSIVPVLSHLLFWNKVK